MENSEEFAYQCLLFFEIANLIDYLPIESLNLTHFLTFCSIYPYLFKIYLSLQQIYLHIPQIITPSYASGAHILRNVRAYSGTTSWCPRKYAYPCAKHMGTQPIKVPLIGIVQNWAGFKPAHSERLMPTGIRHYGPSGLSLSGSGLKFPFGKFKDQRAKPSDKQEKPQASTPGQRSQPDKLSAGPPLRGVGEAQVTISLHFTIELPAAGLKDL